MQIIVVGGGTVGSEIADTLCKSGHSVTVVDHDPNVTRQINDEMDVRVVTGSGSQSSVLFQAGIFGADLCLAVTGSDEVNMVAASMAKGLGAGRSVARVYAPVFRDLSTFDYQGHFKIDRLLSMEHLSAMEIAREIRHPDAKSIENFGRGELEMQEVNLAANAPAVGELIKDLKMPSAVRIGSIRRGGKLRLAGATDRIEAKDLITLIGSRADIDKVKGRFQSETPPKQGIVIAGGGEVGFHLARVLEGRRFAVLVLDSDRSRCEFLAEHLEQATVVQADIKRRACLEEERVGSSDVFVACTGDDEDNIMACVEARELGARRIMAVINRPDYGNVVKKLGIDHPVSPRLVTAKEIQSLLNTGAILSRKPLTREGDIEVQEIQVLEGAPATEHVLAKLDLPAECLITALIRGSYVRVPGADDKLLPGDTVVAMVGQSAFEAVENIFTVE
jgi:trk/ktr system potassium uptake protein